MRHPTLIELCAPSAVRSLSIRSHIRTDILTSASFFFSRLACVFMLNSLALYSSVRVPAFTCTDTPLVISHVSTPPNRNHLQAARPFSISFTYSLLSFSASLLSFLSLSLTASFPVSVSSSVLMLFFFASLSLILSPSSRLSFSSLALPSRRRVSLCFSATQQSTTCFAGPQLLSCVPPRSSAPSTFARTHSREPLAAKV